MKICVFAESDELDKKCYETLIEKIFQNCFLVTNLEFFNHSFRPNGKGELRKYLYHIDYIAGPNPDIDYFLIFMDCDDDNPGDLNRSIDKEINDKVKSFPQNRIVVGYPVKTIESWFFSDIKTINDICNCNMEFRNPDRISDPKGEFKKIWRRKREKFNNYEDLAAEVSKKIRIKNLYSNSSSFKKFHDGLRNALKAEDVEHNSNRH